jgi:hypothetical protein
MSEPPDHSASEEVLGELYATTKLAHGYERLRVVFTARRIVIAHLGKRGISATATVPFFGGAGPGVEDLFLSGRERAKRRSKSPKEILEMDRDNFAISYDEIVSLDYRLGRRLTLVTSGDKFDLFVSNPMPSDLIDDLQRILGPRITAEQ